MTSLTEIGELAKKVVIYGGAAILGLVVVYFAFNFMFRILTSRPEKPKATPPPDTRFGKLPKIKFTGQSKTTGMQFILRNIDGKPPETTASARVFSMPKKLPSLLASERANKFAATQGFSKPPNILTSTNYEYIDSQEPKRKMTMDIVNTNFRIQYDYQTEGQAFFDKTLPLTKERAQSSVQNFVKERGVFDSSLINNRSTMRPLVYNSITRGFDVATSLSTANALRFDYFRSDIAGLKVVTPDYTDSFTYILYAPIPNPKAAYLDLNYTFWPVALDDFASYPLIKSSQAWQALQDGNAVVSKMGENDPNNITIRTISLAYYDTKDPQLYLQPIFVFEGDNGFAAYYPAIAGEWYQD